MMDDAYLRSQAKQLVRFRDALNLKRRSTV